MSGMTGSWMCIPCALALASALALPNAAAAQQTPPPPSCATEEFRRFDFWVGEWVVTNAKGDTIGTSRVTTVSRGCAMLEEWRDRSGGSGTSVNFWEPATRRWNQLWVGGGGAILRLEGDYHDGAMELSGKSARQTPTGPVLDRLRWTPAADGSVEQRWLVSADSGKSWREVFRGIYRKKP
jgi:hypothetical protein